MNPTENAPKSKAPRRTRRPVATQAASPPPLPPVGSGVPSDLAAAAARYGKALDASIRIGETGRDVAKKNAAADRAKLAERRTLALMRTHGITAVIVAGRLVVDQVAFDADPDGGVGLDVGILDVAEVRGI